MVIFVMSDALKERSPNAKAAHALYQMVKVRRSELSGISFDPNYDGLVVVANGYCNELPYDMIALSAWLGIPRTNCHRMISNWGEHGLVKKVKNGRRFILAPTETLLSKLNSIHNNLQKIIQNLN